MSHSSTSNSKSFTWRRILVDGLWLVFVLVALEIVLRIPPIAQPIEDYLSPYENLLWYDGNIPRYNNDLAQDPNYDFWLVGSSYMMTAINPVVIQNELQQTGYDNLTVQNFGLTSLTNLEILGQVFDRQLLQIDQPQHAIIFLAEPNIGALTRAQVLQGQYEKLFLFPDSLQDHVVRFLYENIRVFRYLLLARNVPDIEREQTLRSPRATGGYTERDGTLNCASIPQQQYIADQQRLFADNLPRLDSLINVFQARDIDVIIVHLPVAHCYLEFTYADFEDYQNRYLEPLANHLHNQNIPFFELDTRFYEAFQGEQQNLYFDDAVHVNKDGAIILMTWLLDDLTGWMASGAD